MIAHLQRKSLKIFHPILKRLTKLYLARTKNYNYRDIKLKISPGVFHPGLFFSTKFFIEYLDTRPLASLKILELGAGSGLIAIYSAKRGASVTASDINQIALETIQKNTQRNDVFVATVYSDLFDNLKPNNFDLIIINPPYYPKNPKNMEENAWFCGKNFDYFYKLFSQLATNLQGPQNLANEILMVLSEDCDLQRIEGIANEYCYSLHKLFQKRISGEWTYIFELSVEKTIQKN